MEGSQSHERCATYGERRDPDHSGHRLGHGQARDGRGGRQFAEKSGTDSEVITLIPKGTVVEVGTRTNGWCGVSWDGRDGYSIATNLGLGGPAPARRRPMPMGADEYDYPPPPGTYGPPPGYVVGGPVYYGPGYYGPYFDRPYFGFGWRGGWGFRHRW